MTHISFKYIKPHEVTSKNYELITIVCRDTIMYIIPMSTDLDYITFV
jgi:hypothetical protein